MSELEKERLVEILHEWGYESERPHGEIADAILKEFVRKDSIDNPQDYNLLKHLLENHEIKYLTKLKESEKIISIKDAMSVTKLFIDEFKSSLLAKLEGIRVKLEGELEYSSMRYPIERAMKCLDEVREWVKGVRDEDISVNS